MLQRMREQCEVQAEKLRGVFVTAAQLAERTSELRERCRETRGEPSLSEPAAGA